MPRRRVNTEGPLSATERVQRFRTLGPRRLEVLLDPTSFDQVTSLNPRIKRPGERQVDGRLRHGAEGGAGVGLRAKEGGGWTGAYRSCFVPFRVDLKRGEDGVVTAPPLDGGQGSVVEFLAS
jgi:hypothetical protein